MARNQRDSKNNNPQGRNQYSGGVTDIARERPMAAALGAAAAVGAGVFLWSRRNQISEQIGQLGEQLNAWREDFSTGKNYSDPGQTSEQPFMAASKRSGKKSQQQIAEEALTLKETGPANPSFS